MYGLSSDNGPVKLQDAKSSSCFPLEANVADFFLQCNSLASQPSCKVGLICYWPCIICLQISCQRNIFFFSVKNGAETSMSITRPALFVLSSYELQHQNDISVYMYINQQDAQTSCAQTLFSIKCSKCFGLCQSIIRSNFYKLYITFDVCQYVWLLCGYSQTTDRRIGIYRHIPNAMYSL